MIDKLSTPSPTEPSPTENEISSSSFDNKIDIQRETNEDKLTSKESYNPDERIDPNESGEYYSSYEERINLAKNTDGEWQGDIGESKVIPNDSKIKELLKSFGVDGIEYKNGIPDFSPISVAIVKIPDMTEIRPKNFRQADKACANQWNKEAKDGKTDWTRADVENWRKENGYSWHEHNDMRTMYLVKSEIHLECKHLGGVSECKKYNGTMEDIFDE